jgi:predicted transcriptional regulator of viral defense system
MKMIDYIDRLIAYGRCCFTLNEASVELRKKKQAVVLSIRRLREKGYLASPARGFYVIVSPEFRSYGCLPAEFFIPYLMEHWQCRYYAGLLTAAMYHGASHQQPQVFQVFIEGSKRGIQCGKVRVQFISKANIATVPVQTIPTSKSILTISTSEATAMDLLCYSIQSGGLNRIATVLDELRHHMSAAKLKELAVKQPEIAWKQRLGFLLDKLGSVDLATALKESLSQVTRVDYIQLMPGLQDRMATKNTKWKIIENTDYESDL